MEINLTKDLCPEHDICHRELLRRVDGKWQINQPYTLQQVWQYLWLGILGRKHPLGMRSSFTKEELEKAKAAIIAQIPEMTEAEAQYLYGCCNRYGLQAVLFAIDIYCMDDDIDEFAPDLFSHCLKQGQVEVASALFKYNHPEVKQ